MNELISFRGRVPSYSDALLILQACGQGLLPMVNRRLTESECRQINCGDVYVFDEGISHIKRWSDGRLWSSSRMRDCFLIYVEIGLASNVSGFSSRKYTPSNPSMLMRKKVLSITTSTGDRLRLVAYSNALDDDSFNPTHPQVTGLNPRQDPKLSHIVITPSLFQPTQSATIHASSGLRRRSRSIAKSSQFRKPGAAKPAQSFAGGESNRASDVPSLSNPDRTSPGTNSSNTSLSTYASVSSYNYPALYPNVQSNYNAHYARSQHAAHPYFFSPPSPSSLNDHKTAPSKLPASTPGSYQPNESYIPSYLTPRSHRDYPPISSMEPASTHQAQQGFIAESGANTKNCDHLRSRPLSHPNVHGIPSYRAAGHQTHYRYHPYQQASHSIPQSSPTTYPTSLSADAPSSRVLIKDCTRRSDSALTMTESPSASALHSTSPTSEPPATSSSFHGAHNTGSTPYYFYPPPHPQQNYYYKPMYWSCPQSSALRAPSATKDSNLNGSPSPTIVLPPLATKDVGLSAQADQCGGQLCTQST